MNGKAAHCFALNGDIFAPECNGLEGVLEAYQHALKRCELYGPTWFNEIIDEVNQRCENTEISQYNQEYQILLILTDGIINDMEKTIDQIVRGSDLPLSIVIVGVGEADFENMDMLDADDDPLYSKKYKKYMSRDIVQFVPFSEFKHNPYLLAKETLTEIPGQLVDFFLKRNIYPKPAKEQDRNKIQSQLSLKSKINPSQKMD
jgi:vacuolar-type H+-ATPase subunit F/Vma7